MRNESLCIVPKCSVRLLKAQMFVYISSKFWANCNAVLSFTGIRKEPSKKFVPRTVMIGGKVGPPCSSLYKPNVCGLVFSENIKGRERLKKKKKYSYVAILPQNIKGKSKRVCKIQYCNTEWLHQRSLTHYFSSVLPPAGSAWVPDG